MKRHLSAYLLLPFLFAMSLVASAPEQAVVAAPAGMAGRLVAHHRMALIPDEGAWFALNYVSPDRIPAEALPARYAGTGSRPAGSAIYALITRRDFSALHRLRTDETWHFYGGDVAELLLLHPDGRDELVLFGPDSLAGQRPQVTVPAGVWMGARPARDDAEAYSFFGCTLAPGFDYGDYEAGWRDELAAAYPARAELIEALTRPGFHARPAVTKAAEQAVASGHAEVRAEVAVERSRVFAADAVPAITIAPGVSLRELAGRGGHTRSEAVSFARFRLEAGRRSGSSRYLGSDEYFIVISGTGVATLGAERAPVGPGSVVVIKRGDPHEITADATGPLEFYTVISPAFNPAHYVPEALEVK